MIILIVLLPLFIYAQTPPPEQRLLLLNEVEYFGRIIQEDNVNVWVQLASGMIIRVPKDQIRERAPYARPPFVPVVPFEDPSDSRMIFFPTARSLQRGQGYVAVYEVFMPSVTVGITNRISITGGSTLIPNAQSQVAYIAPKITAWQQSGVHLAAGLMYFKAISNNDGVGVVYGMGTFEKAPFAGMTIGVGWGAGSGELESSGIMFLGGELRLLDGLKLISENWFLLGKGNSVLSIGARFFGQHLAVDVAGYLPLDSGLGENGVPFLPWLGLAYTFGG